jgi:hypothetical protein
MLAASLAGPGCCLQAAESAATNSLNRVNFTPRSGFNVSGRFGSGAVLPSAGTPRTTGRGDRFNYDDGYVLPDATGGVGGQTWYWGYDRSGQIVGNSIAFSRSTVQAKNSEPELESGSSPQFGGELSFSRQLGVRGEVHFGLQAGLNYLRIDLQSSFGYNADVTRVTDTYSFTLGTTPPLAPYRGTFTGPGFLLGSSPSASVSSTVLGGAHVSGERQLGADLFGLRAGPIVEFPVFEVLQLSLSGGLAVGWLKASASWNDSVAVMQGSAASAFGSGDASSIVWGGYLAGQLEYQIDAHWSLAAGVQYQNLGTYQHSFNGRAVELDLSKTIFVTLGVGFSF